MVSADELRIEHAPAASGGAWTIEEGGRQVGEIVYTLEDPATMILVHTEVGPELRGRGAGLKLVETAVAWARENGMTLVAQCPFARATIDKHPELQDVIAR